MNGKLIFEPREAVFAENFFTHSNWRPQPGMLKLSDGSAYYPDFYDGERDVYIEVVGSRQAFYANQYKYSRVMEEFPEITLEFRKPSGEIFDYSASWSRLDNPRRSNLKEEIISFKCDKKFSSFLRGEAERLELPVSVVIRKAIVAYLEKDETGGDAA